MPCHIPSLQHNAPYAPSPWTICHCWVSQIKEVCTLTEQMLRRDQAMSGLRMTQGLSEDRKTHWIAALSPCDLYIREKDVQSWTSLIPTVKAWYA